MQDITLQSLADKARQMREAQKTYSIRRTGVTYRAALALEQQVDEMLSKIPEEPKASVNQKSLFE